MSVDTFCWNVRGFNQKIKRQNFKKWLRQSQPLFGSLIETRVQVAKSHRIIKSTFPGWKFATNYESAELGRIWVVWDPSISISIHSKTSQMINCLIKLPRTTTEVSVSYIYGVNSKTGRQQLWEDIRELARDPVISNKPWALLGDFNQILNPSEKSNGGTRISRGIQDFRNCVSSTGIFDLSIRGNLFTWWNNQEENPIAKKLDRILINDKWQLQFPLSYGHFGQPDISDHSPSCIVLGTKEASKKPFMVSHFLLDHPDFLSRVRNYWQNSSVYGTAMFSLAKNLKMLKPVIKEINKQHYSDLENRVKDAHSVLLQCQNNLLSNPSIFMATREKQAHKTWLALALAEEKFLLQRSRVRWSESGDSNTAYFHRIVASRRAVNQLHYLLDDAGQRLDSLEDVKAHCVDYYTKLFGGSSQTMSDSNRERITHFTKYRCNDATKLKLMAAVTPEDVKQEVFALPLNKTPGPDGFTGEFFRKTWDIIGADLTKAVLEFFQSGQMLRQWNCTAISLIPKTIGAKKLVDFRPISLCNVVYKIVSKILARRLQEITPEMISSNQSAFVKGRLLVENVLLATELVQGFGQTNISKRGLLKVDLRKAFDSVSWEFLIQILKVADFPPIFTNWIS